MCLRLAYLCLISILEELLVMLSMAHRHTQDLILLKMSVSTHFPKHTFQYKFFYWLKFILANMVYEIYII